MHTRRLVLFVVLVTAAVTRGPAQGTVGHFDAGREVRQQKLLTPGTTDTWPLELDVDEVVQCSCESGAFDPVLSLASDQGAVVREDDGEGTRSLVRWRALRQGRHELRVSAFRGSGGGSYLMTLLRFRTGPSTANAEATHTFDKERWWHFRIPLQRGDLLVPIVHGETRITAVLDETLVPLPEHMGSFRARADGDCYVRIEGEEGRRVQLLTQLAHVEERALGAAGAASVPAHGMHVVRFQLPAGTVFRLDANVPPEHFGVAWQVEAKDGRADAVVMPGHFDKPSRIRRYHFARGHATAVLSLRNHTEREAPYDVATVVVGTPLQAGDTANGVMRVGDGALFEMPLLAGQLVDLRLHGAPFDGRLDLWDEAGNVAASNDDGAPGDLDARIRFLVPRSATWRVLAHTAGGVGSGPFMLSCALTDVPEIRANDTRDITVETRSSAYLHLDLQPDEVVWIAVRSHAFDAALQVLDPSGDGSFVREDGGIGNDVLTAYRATRAGRHTLLVHTRSGSGQGEVRVVRP